MPQPISKTLRFGPMPAIIREGVLRRRHVMDDPAFRNCVKAGLDVSAALTALCATPGRLTLPDAGTTMILGARATAAATGLILDGAFSLFHLNATNAGIDFTGQDSGIEYVKILGSQTVLPTAGDAITFTGGQKNFARNIRMEKVFNGIALTNNSETILENIHTREVHGVYGVKTGGAAAVSGVYGARLYNITADAPYPGTTDASKYKGARVASTVYATNDIYTSGGCVYQVTTGGTSAVGTGPNGSHGTTGTRLITDGTAVVQFICSLSLAWISVESFGYSTTIMNSALINGVYGVRMTDALATGSSYPFWLDCVRVESDHALLCGASIEAGKDFSATGRSWFGSCLAGNGVQILSGYKGGGLIQGALIRGNAQTGILLNEAKGFGVHNCDIGSNSQASSGTYNNVSVAANVNGFQIIGNRFMPDPPGTTQAAGRPVVVAAGTSDGYVITNNVSQGHVSANTVNDGGTGVNKSVTANVAY